MKMTKPQVKQDGMVIIGAGHCGGRAALSLRESGWDGPITLIGDEGQLPYERPALSKGILSGMQTLETIHLSHQRGWDEANISLRLKNQALAIDPVGKSVMINTGERVGYHRLLIATGGEARKLQIPGATHPRIHYLRTWNDATRLAPQLQPGKRVVLIGGGFIGLEIAATASRVFCDVTVIEGSDRLLRRAVPALYAERIQSLHQRNGVTLSLGCMPESITPLNDESMRVELENGGYIDADVLIVGIGMRPRTELARSCGLQIDQGILVDQFLKTSDDAIYAAGDVSQFPSVISGQQVRQETWLNAETQGQYAALNMLDQRKPYREYPWFWSDQFDHCLQVCGDPESGTTTLQRILPEDGIMTFYLNELGAITGCSGFAPQSILNKEMKIVRKLIEQQAVVDHIELSSPDFSLKKLLRAA
ncbi:TPA: NAD(P)/FAD-dependent oxidoreductase [Raoultella planticola]